MVTEAKRIQAKPVYTGTCDNMTFEEAWEAITTGKPFTAVTRTETDGYVTIVPVYGIKAVNGVIRLETDVMALYWTADGISSVKPSSPK